VVGRLPEGHLRAGLAVFVPFGLPGEVVRVRLVEEKRNYARAELVEVINPSAARIAPRCAHFGTCGGCHYQHMPYAAQLETKTEILREQLQRLGRIPDPPVQPAVPSPREYYYRNHVQFHLDREGQLGYHKQGSNEVLAIHECHLPEAAINALWPQLDIEALPGLERVVLRQGAGEDLLLALESSDPQLPEFSVEGLPISVVYLGPGESQVLAGSDHLVMEVLGRPLRVSARAFFQVNTFMAGALVKHLLDNLPLGPNDTVVDGYAGVGLFSAFLASRVGQLIGIESSGAACDDFVANLDEFDDVALYQARVEEVFPALEVKPQAIVVDPPRAGLERRTLEAILELAPAHLAYVSCDPTTLGRDARRLTAGGYRLQQVTPFDLFPQTYHIESVSFWERA
jgi:23S rRNA (uracil1939-C5)-methyltransferase